MVELFIGDEFTNKEYQDSLDEIKPLDELVKKYCKEINNRISLLLRRFYFGDFLHLKSYQKIEC